MQFIKVSFCWHSKPFEMLKQFVFSIVLGTLKRSLSNANQQNLEIILKTQKKGLGEEGITIK